MADIVPLRVVPALPPDEDTRRHTIEILDELRAMAEKGEIIELCALYIGPNDMWGNRSSRTNHMAQWIGILEMTKHDWIKVNDRE